MMLSAFYLELRMPTRGSTRPISFSSVGGGLKEKKAKSNVVARGPGPLPMQMPGRVVYMSGKDYRLRGLAASRRDFAPRPGNQSRAKRV
jgi:hypothetical protein